MLNPNVRRLPEPMQIWTNISTGNQFLILPHLGTGVKLIRVNGGIHNSAPFVLDYRLFRSRYYFEV